MYISMVQSRFGTEEEDAAQIRARISELEEIERAKKEGKSEEVREITI
jgi:hypothetical protein